MGTTWQQRAMVTYVLKAGEIKDKNSKNVDSHSLASRVQVKQTIREKLLIQLNHASDEFDKQPNELQSQKFNNIDMSNNKIWAIERNS